MTTPSSSVACPLCGGELLQGGWGKDAPTALAGWPLRNCTTCHHTCSPAAYDEDVDYDALYGADYLAQQIAPLRDARQHAGLAVLPPYLAFSRSLGPGKGRTLLDVGCGAGRFLVVAKQQGWQVRGIEPSGIAVQAATAAGMWLPVSTHTPQQLAAAGQQFDVVTLFDVLEHVADPVALVASVVPLVKPEGLLYITVPNWDCALMQQASRADWLPPVHLQFFTQHSLLQLTDAADPRLISLETGPILTDPQPPLQSGPQWWRWLSRRLRGHPVHSAQLYELLALEPDAPQ